MERSHLVNGRFLHNLDGWTASGGASYHAGAGDAQYGIVVLPVGASIVQSFAVPHVRSYTLSLAVKTTSGTLSTGQATVTIRDGQNNIVASIDLSGDAPAWSIQTTTLGLAPGSSYRITLTNVSASATIYIDDVWLWPVLNTRSDLAQTIHRKLAALATDASLSTTANGAQTEGDYTDAVDAGLRSAGAIDSETDLPDVRWLDATTVDIALDAIEREMLKRLQRHYATVVDLKIGPRDEKLSQISKHLASLAGGGDGAASQGSRKVVTRKLIYQVDDYEL